jgi:hypothetical protein
LHRRRHRRVGPQLPGNHAQTQFLNKFPDTSQNTQGATGCRRTAPANCGNVRGHQRIRPSANRTSGRARGCPRRPPRGVRRGAAGKGPRVRPVRTPAQGPPHRPRWLSSLPALTGSTKFIKATRSLFRARRFHDNDPQTFFLADVLGRICRRRGTGGILAMERVVFISLE